MFTPLHDQPDYIEVSTMPKSIKDKVKELEKQNRLLTENLVDSIWVIDAETLRYEFSAPPLASKACTPLRNSSANQSLTN